MKKLTAIILGSLFVAAIALAFNTVAVAAPPGHGGPHGGGHHVGPHHGGGHHGGHHGGGHRRHHWGFGPSFYASTLPSDCYMVKKCYINEFGRRRCRWVEVCD